MQIPETVHPEIRKSLEAIETPEVQTIIQQLAKYGLAVALPHAHGEIGNFLPLPDDQVAFESNQQVSFVSQDDPALVGAVPVMWRWNGKTQMAASCAVCDLYKHPVQ